MPIDGLPWHVDSGIGGLADRRSMGGSLATTNPGGAIAPVIGSPGVSYNGLSFNGEVLIEYYFRSVME